MAFLVRLFVSVAILVHLARAFQGETRRKYRTPSPLQSKRQHVTFKNLDAMIDSFDRELVLLAFTSDKCGPCKIQTQELERLAQRDRSLRMLRIDMNHFPKLGSKFNIGKLPCTMLVQQKEVVLRADGLITAQELWDKLQLLPYQQHNPPES